MLYLEAWLGDSVCCCCHVFGPCDGHTKPCSPIKTCPSFANRGIDDPADLVLAALRSGYRLRQPDPVRFSLLYQYCLPVKPEFGIPYFPGEQPLDLVAVGERLSELLPSARRALPDTELIIELRRFIVGEAGIYVCRVVERKVSRGQVFLVTDGGLHHHLAASGNFGQVIRKNYPVLVANRVESNGEPETASVVGPLCTPLDLLADRMPLGHAREGDLIAVMQSGAYGLTASPTAFLGHPPVVEVLV